MVGRKKLLLLLALVSATSGLRAIDNAHFYKAARLHRAPTTSWWDEAKKYNDHDWLTKFDFSYAYGDAGSCWDKTGRSAPLLNGTGNHDMLYLMQNVPLVNPTNAIITNANNVNAALTFGTFGQLEFDGKFEIHDFNLDLRQNFVSGFFAEAHLPIRDVSIKNIGYKDLSPAGNPAAGAWRWPIFLNQLDALLALYGLKAHNAKYSQTDVGDLSILVGWQGINEKDENDTTRFLGLTLKGGILFPTGSKEKVDYVFSVPTGYNGHWGIPLSVELEAGFRKWLTLSVHASALFFIDDDNQQKRMKTFTKQQGYLKLAQGEAEEEKGTLWHIGADLKFDHVFKGLSLLVGYSYNRQEEDELLPKDTTNFDKSVVNSDPLLDGWYTHVLHLMLDYDFSVHMKDKKWGPRLSVFYDYPFDGKNAFKTDMIGGGFGIDIRWKM